LKTKLHVSFVFEGEHCYPQAIREDIRKLHTHYFLATVYFPVRELSREVELLDFRDELKAKVTEKFGGKFGSMSCEEIAVEIAQLVWSLIRRRVTVTVSEEMCGATVSLSNGELERLVKGRQQRKQQSD